MTTAQKRRAAARAKASLLGQDGPRVLTVCLCFVLLIAIGIEIGVGAWVPGRPGAAQWTLADDNLTTGSIVLVPPSGNDCRLRQIDNATWNIRGNVAVDCQAALSNTKPQSDNQRASHIDIIRDGFRNR